MRSGRLPSLVLVAIALLLAPPPARAALDNYTLEAFGGTYLADCAKPEGPRVVLSADAITVIDGAKRVTAGKLETAASWYGNSSPPEYRTVVLSRTGEDPGLLFALYEDAKGYYGRLDGDTPSLAGIRPELVATTFRLCKTAAPAPAPAPAPAAPPASAKQPEPEPAPAASAAPDTTGFAPEPDSSGAASVILKDKAWRTAYTKELGPRMRERWLAVLDGPAPPVRTVRIGEQDFTLAATCKAHDCAANNMIVLWAPGKKPVMYGLVRHAGVNALLGAPPPAMATEVTRLWQETWRPAPAAEAKARP